MIVACLKAGLEHHQAGQLDQAEALYRRVLALEPNQPDALHLLGMTALANGQFAEALRLARRAVQLKPNEAAFVSDSGTVLEAVGQFAAPADLSVSFPDVCRPFKEHFGVDLARNWRASISRHHRRNIGAAAQAVEVERSERPRDWLETWVALYGQLAVRRSISGPARFSRESFRRQLQVPGIVAFRAVCDSQTVAMSHWFRDGAVAYYHLGASDRRGYESSATFALFDVALGHFAATGARWAQLGGAAGCQATAGAGLARFKAGWANDRRTAWFCGRVQNRLSYERLAVGRTRLVREFFPSYRQPEAA